jgi:predicted phosphodiesterase
MRITGVETDPFNMRQGTTCMRLAVLADIHGNIHALEAVLADLKRQSPDQIVVLGDSILKFAHNRAVLDALDDLPHVGIAGNMERGLQLLLGDECADLSQYDTGDGIVSLKRQVLAELGAERVARFRDLPTERSLTLIESNDALLCHGSPGSLTESIYPAPDAAWPGPDQPTTSDGEFEAKLQGVTANLVLCAHSHRRIERRYNGILVVNPGGVGHTYERKHDPRASYALLSYRAGEWTVEFRLVPFDGERVVQEMLAAAPPDGSVRRYLERIAEYVV